MTAETFGAARLDFTWFEPLGEWASEAACVGSPPEWWDHVERNDPDREAHTRDQYRAALKCAGCPVRTECALDAVRNEHVGIWGGYLFGVDGRRGIDLTAQTPEWWENRIRRAQDVVRAGGDAA